VKTTPTNTYVYTSKSPVLVIERGEPVYFLRDPRLTAWQNFVSEAASSAIVKNIFYPIDVAQTLMQTNSPDAKGGIIPTLLHLQTNYGISSWFRGNVASNLSGTVLALAAFYLKALMSGQTIDNRILAFLASILPTQLAVAGLYPLQVAKVRMITNPLKYEDTISTLAKINDEEGAAGLYKGLTFTLLETIPAMATTYAGYELAGLFFRKPREDLTIAQNIALGILGTAFAALLHYPLDTAKKIYISRKSATEGEGVLKTLADVGERHGLDGLYQGFTSQFFKAPALFVQRAFYQVIHNYFLKANGIPAPYYYPTYIRRL
jgi:hypothetical protein